MSETVYQVAALIVPLVIAIVFHEVAHGYVAKLLGDPTAHERGRLTLNPLRHVDPIGTVILPGMFALAHLPVFGWAKPVPVIKQRLRNPRWGMMAVAAAGPASNLLQGTVAAVLLGLLLRTAGQLDFSAGVAGFIALNLFNYISINIFLALFNLLPIPPFDGSHIVEGLLPRALAPSFASLWRYGFLFVIVLIVVLPSLISGFDPIGRVVVPPVEWLKSYYLALAGAVAGL